ncbi:MAG TPA: carboxymuconolactone decarboxylase family protein [Thermoanaerobaculia bacterium]|jgi:alkyl hydroperoxide reductase subunit D|nr:carboxymuconolactone decarboxylase family protein [Thermoanaerobaculia bacterium]
MSAVDALRASIPDSARDIKLNLQAVLQTESLTPAQRWGTAIASAVAARSTALRDALIADARAAAVSDAVIEDALAAAALMAMNNVYYRFRHMIGKPSYTEKPARLRMQRIARPAASKVDFELFCLAVSAINGCEMCMRSHEQVVLAGGLSEDQVHDAVRIAATVNAAAVALELPAVAAVAVAGF